MESRGARRAPHLDLQALPPDVAAALEAALAGESVTLVRAGRPLGTLEFRPAVLEGTVVDRPGRRVEPEPAPRGVTVVATAMKLSEAARRRLADEFGADYVVLDLLQAPPSTDVLLVNPVSPQLLGMLSSQFPGARVVVTEIEDEELGVSYPGPVSRLLDAGAHAYLPPRPIAQLAAQVHTYLTQGGERMLEAGRQQLGPAAPGQVTVAAPAPSRPTSAQVVQAPQVDQPPLTGTVRRRGRGMLRGRLRLAEDWDSTAVNRRADRT